MERKISRQHDAADANLGIFETAESHEIRCRSGSGSCPARAQCAELF